MILSFCSIRSLDVTQNCKKKCAYSSVHSVEMPRSKGSHRRRRCCCCKFLLFVVFRRGTKLYVFPLLRYNVISSRHGEKRGNFHRYIRRYDTYAFVKRPAAPSHEGSACFGVGARLCHQFFSFKNWLCSTVRMLQLTNCFIKYGCSKKACTVFDSGGQLWICISAI